MKDPDCVIPVLMNHDFSLGIVIPISLLWGLQSFAIVGYGVILSNSALFLDAEYIL